MDVQPDDITESVDRTAVDPHANLPDLALFAPAVEKLRRYPSGAGCICASDEGFLIAGCGQTRGGIRVKRPIDLEQVFRPKIRASCPLLV